MPRMHAASTYSTFMNAMRYKEKNQTFSTLGLLYWTLLIFGLDSRIIGKLLNHWISREELDAPPISLLTKTGFIFKNTFIQYSQGKLLLSKNWFSASNQRSLLSEYEYLLKCRWTYPGLNFNRRKLILWLLPSSMLNSTEAEFMNILFRWGFWE